MAAAARARAPRRRSAIAAASHNDRSWSASETSPSGETRAAERASVSSNSAQQPVDLGLVGHQPHQQPREPDRLRAQLAAGRRVALVEDQVDDAQDAGEPLDQQVVGRHPERDPRVGDLVARPRQAPLHRAVGREERARDLAHRQARDAAQGQRHPRLGRERRMAAGEEQLQLVVVQRGLLEELEVVAHVSHQLGGVRGGDLLVAQAVERLAPRGGRQPGTGAVRRAAAVPLDRRGHERVLDDVLGECEVTVQAARDGRQDRGALVAVGPLERFAHASSNPCVGVIETEPYSVAGIFFATAIAASRSSTSMM